MYLSWRGCGGGGGSLTLGYPDQREAVGVIGLYEFYQSFPYIATQVEGIAGAAGAHQGADLDGLFGSVGDLHDADAFVPQGVILQQAREFFS